MKTATSQRGALPFRRSTPHCTARNIRGFLIAVIVVVPLLAARPLPAQNTAGTVEGRVQNAVSGDYLNNARIAVAGTNRVVFSDSTGDYRISNLPAGPHTLRISYTGLEAQEIAIQVTPAGVVRQDVGLTSASRYEIDPHTVKLDPITVAATREMDAASLAINEQRFASNIKNVIAADAFGDVSEGNVGEFIKRLPGVSINYAAGDAYSISLRGFSPEFTPITVDGNDVPSASFSATSVSRGSNLEQVSMSNVARVEVVKSPIPSVAADSLGGSVNLLSKSAFERSKPQLTVRGTLQFTSDDYSWSKTPGPGNPKTRKLRPGYEVSYVNPVSKNFGFTISSLLSDQFGRLLGPIRTFEFAAAQGGSMAAPYLRSFRTTDDPRETRRESYAASADWRPFEGLTLSAGFRHNIYDLFTAPQRMTINTGNNPASHSSTHTQGRAGAGSIVHQQIWTTKFGNTDQFSLSGRYRKDAWRADFKGSYANSGNKYRDVENGFFRGATTRMVSPTVAFQGFGSEPGMPGAIEVRTASGNVVDWTRLQNYQLVNVLSVERDATDEITSGTFNLRRDLALGGTHGAIQVGGSYRKREVDRDARDETRTFVGADGVALTADDAAGPFVDPNYGGVNQKFGVPRDIQWPDLRALHRLYRERPAYFSFPLAARTASYIFETNNSERIKEEISAAYIQGEIKLFESRVAVVGGVRFEHTDNVGVGRLRDRDAVYQRDAAGRLVRAANGNPVFITNDTLERAKLEYQRRALKSGTSYSDYYPSVNLAFNATSDLLVRLSYARTLGRPNFSNVVPNLDIIEDLTSDGAIGRIVARNPRLEPWTGDNFEASIEYYFKSSGVASAGVFRKDISNGFGTRTVILDEGLLAQYELDATYLGWDLQSTFNIGELVKITGLELNYQQQLTFLPPWARGLSVYGNTTILDIDGPITAFSTLYKRTSNWGASYSRGRVSLGLNWNYQSSRISALTTLGPDGQTYTRSYLTLDLNSEFRFRRKLSVFFNARNLSNTLLYVDRFSSQTRDYSRTPQATDRGVKMSAGIRATF